MQDGRGAAWSLRLVAALMLVVACGSRGPTPVDTVKGFLAAIEGRNYRQAVEYVAPELRGEAWKELVEATRAVSSFRLLDMQYATEEDDGSMAKVRLSGIAQAQSQGFSGQVPIGGMVPLVKREGKWYISALLKDWFITGQPR